MNNPLSYIMIKKNAINKNGIDMIIDYMKRSDNIEKAKVFDSEASNVQKKTVFKYAKEIRDVELVGVSDLIKSHMNEYFNYLSEEIINPFYGVEVDEYVGVNYCKYDVGGHYLSHCDSEQVMNLKNGKDIWKKVLDRDLSIVLYLNDDFEGGELFFSDYNIKVKPEAGLLLTFPSTHKYMHSVEPVTKGTRYAMVCWATIKGFITVSDQDKLIQQLL